MTPLGVFEWEQFEHRAVASPMPVAPPPMQGRGLFDVSLRELGATRTSGGELASHPQTGMQPLRTDLAGGVRLTDFFGVRVLGALGYGSPLGAAPTVGFPDRASAGGGLGAVLGYWGDAGWSIALELEGRLVLLDDRDRFATVRGHCFESYTVFGTGGMSCRAETRTGAIRTYEGMHIVPALGGTLDVAGAPIDWLRLGAGASVQEHVSRDDRGAVHHEVVGIARLFVELHLVDVWIGLEAQQWIVENVTFAPALAVTLGGVAFERASPANGFDDGDDVVPENERHRTPPTRLPPDAVDAPEVPAGERQPLEIPWLPGVAP